jgi:hypothetical protein
MDHLSNSLSGDVLIAITLRAETLLELIVFDHARLITRMLSDAGVDLYLPLF